MARTVSADAAPKVQGRGVLTLAIVGALVVATGTPDVESLAMLTGWGVPETVARVSMYVAPVLGIVLAMVIGRAVGRGRSMGVRWILYALLGGFAGFFTGFCLDLFAGVPDIIAMLSGPLAEPEAIEIILWSLGALCIALGLMVGLIGVFGQPAVNALQVEEMDPECIEVRKSERGVFALSGIGLMASGLTCCALAVARQAAEPERLGPVIVAFAAGVVAIVLNYVLWRGFDEMQRRHVIDGFAASAVVVTLGVFVWAGLEAVGLVFSVDAAGVYVSLTVVQLIATSYVTSSVMGQMGAFGKPV